MKNQRDFDEIKRKFLEEVAKGKAGIAELAKKYGISKPCAYTWVRKNNKVEKAVIQEPNIKFESLTTIDQEVKETSPIDIIILEAVASKKKELIETLHSLNISRTLIMNDIEILSKFLAKYPSEK